MPINSIRFGILFVFVLLLLAALPFWRGFTTRKLVVSASLYPIAFFAEQISGTDSVVRTVTPVGVEPHDYEPSAGDMVGLLQSNLVLVNGSLEPWLEKVRPDLIAQHVPVVIVGEGVIAATSHDPHVWLDPILAKEQVSRIAQALIAQDPSHQRAYLENTQQLQRRLDELDQSFSQGLAECDRRSFVAAHQAFLYVANRYGLKQLAIQGPALEEDVAAQHLVSIVKSAQQAGMTHIFVETLVNPRLAETIAREVGLQTLVLNPIEGLTEAEKKSGVDYFSLQQQNLQNLRLALGCH